MTPSKPPPPGADVVFLDGTCIMCSRIAAFIAAFDTDERFYFSHLQGGFARSALPRHLPDGIDLDAIYLLTNVGTPDEALYADGLAGRRIWPALFRIAFVLRFVPLPILNFFYWLGARTRFWLFGRFDRCTVPSERVRSRFVDVAAQ